jgi:hypothetical protein
MPSAIHARRDPIATREFRACHPDRGSFTITVRSDRPVRASEVDWSCGVELKGLYEKLAPQHGVDDWQALMFAQKLARTLLSGFIEDGGQIFDLNNEVTDVNHLFNAGI